MAISRRQILRLSALSAAALGLAACGGTAAPVSAPGASSVSAASPASTAKPVASAGGSAAGTTTRASASTGAPAASPKKGGQLVVAIPTDVTPPLDPPQSLDNQTGFVMNTTVFEGLLTNAPGSTDLVPLLAEKYEVASDGKAITFHLRQNVKFHDGTPFDANAVKLNVERQTDKNNEFYKFGKWLAAPISFDTLDKVTVVDPLTVRYDLKAPSENVLNLGATQAMLSPAAIKKYGADIITNPVGTGPFKYSSWAKGVKFVTERFDSYWGGSVPLDQVIFTPVTDPQAKLVALQTGNAQLMVDAPYDALPGLQADTNSYNILQLPSRYTWGIILNLKNVRALSDKRVRQALNYAVDKQSIIRDILKGTGSVADGPLSEAYGNQRALDISKFPFDQAKAKQLLADAGFGSGFSAKMLVPQSGPNMLQPVPMATVIQSNLAQVGFKVDIQSMDFASFNNQFLAGNFDMAARSIRFSSHDSLSNVFNTSRQPKNGFNTGYYSNPQFDDLVKQAAMQPGSQGLETYKQAEKLLVDDAPWIWITHPFGIYVSSTKITGVLGRGDALLDFSKVSFV